MAHSSSERLDLLAYFGIIMDSVGLNPQFLFLFLIESVSKTFEILSLLLLHEMYSYGLSNYV